MKQGRKREGRKKGRRKEGNKEGRKGKGRKEEGGFRRLVGKNKRTKTTTKRIRHKEMAASIQLVMVRHHTVVHVDDTAKESAVQSLLKG